jgi:hypothetical protein
MNAALQPLTYYKLSPNCRLLTINYVVVYLRHTFPDKLPFYTNFVPMGHRFRQHKTCYLKGDALNAALRLGAPDQKFVVEHKMRHDESAH